MDPELADEQEHLDRTYAAYDALLRELSVSRRDRQGDEFTEEVLERMRLERLRAYTAVAVAEAGCAEAWAAGRCPDRGVPG